MDFTSVGLPFKSSVLFLLLAWFTMSVARGQSFEAFSDTLSSTPSGITFFPAELLDNDIVSAGDSLRMVVVSQPVNGSLERQPDGSLVYRPTPGFLGADRFVYQWETVPLQHLSVDPGVSILSFDAELQTDLGPSDADEEIPVEGSVVAYIGNDPASIDSVHVIGVDLTNSGDHSLRFEYGSPISIASLRIIAAAGDVALSLVEPGPASAATGVLNTWQQPDNLVDVSVSAALQGTGLFSNQVPTDTQNLQTQTTEGLSGAVFGSGGQVVLLLNVASSNTFDLDGSTVTLDISGSLQASGTFVASRLSTEAVVVIQVASGASADPGNLPVTLFETFPNPVRDVLHLRWEIPPGPHEIVVYDLLGRRIHAVEVQGMNEMKRTLDASNWSPGVYFVRLTGSAASQIRMIVRQ